MKKTTIVHIVLLSAIVLLVGLAAYRLISWNMGSDPEANIEQVDPSEFDVEVMDMIIPMDSSRLDGHEQGEEITILCLGNNPFSDDRSEKGLSQLIGQKTKGRMINASFPNSSSAFKYYPMDPNYPMDHFSLPSIANALLISDYGNLYAAANYMDNPDAYIVGVQALETVDMNAIDVIVIMYDSTDYNNGTPCTNEAVPEDPMAFTGGIAFFLDVVNQNWPHIRTFVMTPTYAQYMDANGKLYSGTTKDIGNGPLPFYVENEVGAVVGKGCSVIDNYYGTINEDNYKEYMTDHMHYNDKGREVLADRIAEVINKAAVVTSSGDEG